jgi:protein SCO1/2
MRTHACSQWLMRTSAAVGVVLALAGCGAKSSSPAPDPGVGTVLDRQLSDAVSSIRLRDAAGHPVSLSSYRGKTVVISDSMTLCSEDCPLDTANIVAAARAADAGGATQKVEFLTVTVDPRRDDARHLTAYRGLYASPRQLPNWQLLTGTQSQITRFWKYFGVYWHRVPQGDPPDHDWLTGKRLTYDVQHADEVLLVDPAGRWRMVISGHAHVQAPRGVPTRMRAFLSSEGRRHLEHPGSGTWTYHDVLQGLTWLTSQGPSS